MGDEIGDGIGDMIGDGTSPIHTGSEPGENLTNKPKKHNLPASFRNITIEARQKRLALIRSCVQLGMTAEQMLDYLPTVGQSLSRTTLYDYLATIRLPRSYRSGSAHQSDHDRETLRTFIRISRDAAKHGFRTDQLAKGKAPTEGARFRADFSWKVRHFQFHLETQLSDLTQTHWTAKFRNWVNLRHNIGRPFYTLFVIEQEGDLGNARRHLQQILASEEDFFAGLIRFLPLSQLDGSANLAMDRIWLAADGHQTALLEYLVK
jgi:hypothetical protein